MKAVHRYQTHHLNADSTLVIPYLKAGKYAIRITGDLNGNGWDTGTRQAGENRQNGTHVQLSRWRQLADLAEKWN